MRRCSGCSGRWVDEGGVGVLWVVGSKASRGRTGGGIKEKGVIRMGMGYVVRWVGD